MARAPLLVLLGALLACAREPDRAPNILLILADDLAPGSLGFEGHPCARTPSLDALARAGTYLRRAYVPTPQCAPSRAALLLGRYPHETGTIANASTWDRRLPTLAQVLNEGGYRSGFVGKWHLGDDRQPQAGFEGFWRAIERSQHTYFDPDIWVDGRRQSFPGYMPTVLTDLALEFLERPSDQPFFLWLAYTTPHEPITPPPDPALRVDPASVPLPVSASDDLSQKPSLQRESAGHRIFRERGPDEIRQVVAVYHAMIAALDREIGRLLAALEQRGLRDDTLVVFLSDNGTLGGEHQMVTKGPAFYEELVRTPLVLSWPGVVPAGAVRQELVSSLDLFPTLARLAGAEPPGALAGLDVWSLVADGTPPAREQLYLEYARKEPDDPPTPMLGLVSARHKYVRYLESGEEELYDLERDPHELENLALAPEESALLAELRARLAPFRSRTAGELR